MKIIRESEMDFGEFDEKNLFHIEDITWLVGPMAELKARLLQIRKIWDIEVAVLNEGLAREHKLIK